MAYSRSEVTAEVSESTGRDDRAARPRRLDPRRITNGAPFFPLLVLFGLNAVDELDQAAFNVLLPDIRDHFGLDNESVLTLVALVAPVAIVIGIPVASYADRHRRTTIAATGGAVWSAFSFFTGLAPNVAALFTARSGSSLGKAVNLPTHNSLLSDYYPIDVRAKVYGFHRAANSVGLMLGPLLAGVLAFLFSWRAPFLVFSAFTVVFVFLAFGLREPTRGIMDRLAHGADLETADLAEPPARFGESWRLLHSIVTLRRLFFALPFLAASIIGVQSIVSLFYEEVYGVTEAGRGVLIAFDEPFAIGGLLLGAPMAQRILERDPGLALKFIAGVAVANGACLLLLAASPTLAVAVVGSWLSAFVRALLYPALLAIFSLVIPARTRSLGFQAFAVWTLPGLIALPIVGGIGDDIGFRWAVLFLMPLYVLGGLILSTAAPSVARDIENNRRWSRLEAEARREKLRVAAAVARGEAEEPTLPLLDVRNIDFSYGPMQVLFDVSLQIGKGERVALLGTNGAGKSTVLKVISGLLQPDVGTGGSVWFKGDDVTWTIAEDRVRLGMTLIGGGRATFPSLTVEENLRIGAYDFLENTELVDSRVAEVVELFPVLGRRARQRAGTLSGGEQQMMALGRALVAGPELLMIDELSLGLAPVVMGEILRMVEEIAARGTTLLIVEQSLNVAATISDHGYFMEKGEIRYSGPTADLLHRGDLARSVFFGQKGPTT